MDLLSALLATGDDEYLSRGERRAIRALLADDPITPQARAAVRRQLIDAVGKRVRDPRDRKLITWLGDVLALIDADASGSGNPEARAWFGPDDGLADILVTSLAAAQESIDAAVFTITDDRVAGTLLARHRAGVRVRILTDNDKAWDKGSDIRRLAAQGIPVVMDDTPHHFHHKFAVLDGRRLLNGSYNWTRSGDRYNHENLMLTTDPRLVGKYVQAFEEMWVELGPPRVL